MSLLAQTVPTLPDWQWWANFGVLGIGGVVVVASGVAYFWLIWWPDRRERLKLERDRRKALQELEIQKEHKTIAFLDTVRECQAADHEFKGRLVEVTEKLAKGQENHARDCA